jgi:O-antigen/teichoic acid export membrane protein
MKVLITISTQVMGTSIVKDVFNKMVQYVRNISRISSEKIIFGLAGSTFIANLVTFALTPVVARIYGPRTIGIFFGLLALSSITTVVISRKAEINIPLLKSNKKAVELLVSNLLSSVIFIVILNLVIYLITVLEFIPDEHILIRHRIEFTLITLILVLYANLTQISLRYNSFNQIRDRNLLQPVIVVFFQIALGFKYPTVISLMSAELIGRITSLARTIFSILQIVSKDNIVKAFNKKFLFYISRGYLYFVFESIFSVYFLLFVMYKYGSYIGGQFAISWKIATAPAALFGLAISQFLIMKISRSRNKKQKIKLILVEIRLILISLSLLFGFGLLVLGLFIVEPMLGSSWNLSSDFLIVLVIFSVTNMLWIIYANLMVLIERQEILQLSAKIKVVSLSIASSIILSSDMHSVTAILILANVSSVTDLISIKIARKALKY